MKTDGIKKNGGDQGLQVYCVKCVFILSSHLHVTLLGVGRVWDMSQPTPDEPLIHILQFVLFHHLSTFFAKYTLIPKQKLFYLFLLLNNIFYSPNRRKI